VYERARINNPRASNVLTEAAIFLRADLDTRYENVFSVMNVLQDEGFIKVAIVAEDAAAG
jgi:biopolymer transport protein ExbD